MMDWYHKGRPSETMLAAPKSKPIGCRFCEEDARLRLKDNSPYHAAACALAEQALLISGRLSLRVQGGSMLPSVWPGDTVRIRRSEIMDLAPGDIALYSRNGRFVVHRVVANDGRRLITRGDAFSCDDPPVEAGQVLGRVVEIQGGQKRRPLREEPAFAFTLLRLATRRSGRLKAVILRLHAIRMKIRRRLPETRRAV